MTKVGVLFDKKKKKKNCGTWSDKIDKNVTSMKYQNLKGQY